MVSCSVTCTKCGPRWWLTTSHQCLKIRRWQLIVAYVGAGLCSAKQTGRMLITFNSPKTTELLMEICAHTVACCCDCSSATGNFSSRMQRKSVEMLLVKMGLFARTYCVAKATDKAVSRRLILRLIYYAISQIHRLFLNLGNETFVPFVQLDTVSVGGFFHSTWRLPFETKRPFAFGNKSKDGQSCIKANSQHNLAKKHKVNILIACDNFIDNLPCRKFPQSCERCAIRL